MPVGWSRVVYILVFLLSSQCVVEAAQLYAAQKLKEQRQKEQDRQQRKIEHSLKTGIHTPRRVEEVKPKLIDVSGIALGLPIKGNENVYMQTSGLYSCTGLVITDQVNTLLAHIVHEGNTKEVIKACLEEIERKSGGHNKGNIKVRAYYTPATGSEGANNAGAVVEIAKSLGIEDAKSIEIPGMLIINIHGEEVASPSSDKPFFIEKYNQFLDQKEKELKEKYKLMRAHLDEEWKVFYENLGEENYGALDKFEDLEAEGEHIEAHEHHILDEKWRVFEEKLKSFGLEWVMHEYPALKEQGRNIEAQQQKEEATMRATNKEQIPLLFYLKIHTGVVHPWSVQTLQ